MLPLYSIFARTGKAVRDTSSKARMCDKFFMAGIITGADFKAESHLYYQ